MSFSGIERQNTIEKMQNDSYDVLVIGGGITGAGIALDASKRGMKVALIEMQDFSAGTSSRSTKLIHGGLRYLKQLQVGVVMHSEESVQSFMKMDHMSQHQNGCYCQCIKMGHLVH